MNKKFRVMLGCIILSVSICVVGSSGVYAADKYMVYKDKTKSYKGRKSTLKSIGTVVSSKNSVKGTYPTRKGVILITSTGKVASVVGHAAIVYSAGYIVESVENGVAISRNNWKTKKKNMAAVTVRDTTIAQDKKVSDWCKSQKGKKYNYNYYDMNTNKSYYCSQLIWAGFKKLYNINLNTKTYDVGEKRAIGPYELVTKSCSKVYPIYMKNWNR